MQRPIETKTNCREVLNKLMSVRWATICDQQQLKGTKEHALAAGKTMFNAFVRIGKRRLQKDTLFSYLEFLNRAAWPSPLSSEWEAFGVSQILGLCKAWSKFLVDVHKYNDVCEGVEAQWHQVQKFVLRHGLLKMDTRKNCALDFWRPIIKARWKFTRFHIILRCALALSPTSADVESPFSLLNHITRADRRSPEMDMLQKLLIVAQDKLPFTVYDFDPVVEVYRKKRRVRALRGERADKGKRRRHDGGVDETDADDVDDAPKDHSADEGQMVSKALI